mgnify:CR=1 FL=1
MALELKNTEHSYYCSDNNYYVGGAENFGRCDYDTWEDFKEEWLVVRWKMITTTCSALTFLKARKLTADLSFSCSSFCREKVSSVLCGFTVSLRTILLRLRPSCLNAGNI